MAVAIDAPAAYVAGRKMKVKLLDPESGEPILEENGKPRCEDRLPGDPVPEARFWGTQFWTNRMCGDLLTPDEVERGIVRPSPGVVQSERLVAQARGMKCAAPPRPASEEPPPVADEPEPDRPAAPATRPRKRPKARRRPRG